MLPAAPAQITAWFSHVERPVFYIDFLLPLDTSIRYTEEELVQLLRLKTEAGFAYLYRQYSAVLYAIIRKVVAEEATAEDVLQEAFLKIWRGIDSYDAGKGRIYTWMLNIARNAAIDKLRSKGEIMRGKIRGGDGVVDEIAGAPVAAQPAIDGIGLRGLVEGLRPEQQTIVHLAYYKGYTLDEIGKTLGIPLGTVKTRMRAAILQLRKTFNR